MMLKKFGKEKKVPLQTLHQAFPTPSIYNGRKLLGPL